MFVSSFASHVMAHIEMALVAWVCLDRYLGDAPIRSVRNVARADPRPPSRCTSESH
jgi:hypothetical protein